jgi:hypothetical protein
MSAIRDECECVCGEADKCEVDKWIIDDEMHEGKSFNIKIIWKRKRDDSVPYRLAARQTRL